MSDLILENNTFGVEIETASPIHKDQLAIKLKLLTGLSVTSERYNHTDSYTNWKIVTDSTIHTTSSHPYDCEIVSPILKGETGLNDLEKMLTALNDCNVKVNKSCGLHIHHDAKMLNATQMIKLSQFYTFYETALDSLMPMSRRYTNSYNVPMKHRHESSTDLFERVESKKALSTWIAREQNISAKEYNMSTAFSGTFRRECKLNIQRAFQSHKTIEFRHHSSTTEFAKLKNWIILTQAMMVFASNNRKKISKDHKPSFARMFKLLEVSKEITDFYLMRRLILRDKYFSFNSGCTKQDTGRYEISRARSAGSRCFLGSASNGTMRRYIASQQPECEGDFSDIIPQVEQTYEQAIANL
tara:strand:- start:2180 stop:3250 length:1071 start_codon:yes stop_codon:yes gene_type:complete